MKTFLGLAAAAALVTVVSATTSSAAVLYASQNDSFNQGTIVFTHPGRDDPANALGMVDGAFLSLGLGGDATFSFGTPAGAKFGSPGVVIEVTTGVRANHVETADIYGVNGLIETLIGSITNSVATNMFTFSGFFTQLKLVDTSPPGSCKNPAKGFGCVGSTDGFDIDSISVTPAPVPLPAGGLLLLTAIGGIAVMRRRKAA